VRPVTERDRLRIPRTANVMNVRVAEHLHTLRVDAMAKQYGQHHP
jgi:hypothetical protein